MNNPKSLEDIKTMFDCFDFFKCFLNGVYKKPRFPVGASRINALMNAFVFTESGRYLRKYSMPSSVNFPNFKFLTVLYMKTIFPRNAKHSLTHRRLSRQCASTMSSQPLQLLDTVGHWLSILMQWDYSRLNSGMAGRGHQRCKYCGTGRHLISCHRKWCWLSF